MVNYRMLRGRTEIFWVVVYEVITQLIILLSVIRDRVTTKHTTNYIRKERTFRMPVKEGPPDQGWGIVLTCCDCNLGHFSWRIGDHLFQRPIRPGRYNYRLRLLSTLTGDTAEFKEEW